MALHLVKLAVGIDSFEHMRQRQQHRLANGGGAARLQFLTRFTPRRAAEIVDGGGSLYSVIKGYIQARRRITAIEPAVDRHGSPCCALVFAPELVATEPRRFRPFQGWRYLEDATAPRDLPNGEPGDLPPTLAAELRALGIF